MPNLHQKIVEVALPVPLTRYFDYRLSTNESLDAYVGQRIQVPFGSPRHGRKGGARKLIGIITAVKNESDIEESKLKAALRILDAEPLLDARLIKLLKWSAQYYHFPPGAVFEAALPVWLRKKTELPEKLQEQIWTLSELGKTQLEDTLLSKLKKRAPVQARMLQHLSSHPAGVKAKQLNQDIPNWRDCMRRLEKKQWVRSELSELPLQLPISDNAPELSDEQTNAITAITASLDKSVFSPFLLQGVTGSGKTEVYLAAAEQALKKNKQVLCLVPEIALTSQFIQRFEQRLQTPLAVLHSGVNDRSRCLAWLAAQDGSAKVILGTRSAIFTPMKNPGLIVIDEEHDSSFKQQDGFQYSARDLALLRAKYADIPIVLGSATPSLESLHKSSNNNTAGSYQHLQLKHRPGKRPLPLVKLIDLKHEPSQEGMSYPLLASMQKVLDKNEQVLIFLNRRGFAPVLLCPSCMWSAICSRCDVNMTYHHAKKRLRCHHCNKEEIAAKHCPSCKHEVKPIGQGTERIESFLRTRFPNAPVIRIDRDTMRNKNQMQEQFAAVHAGGAKILVGTQMLTKGHDFPDVTLVGVLNADSGLFSSDFRSSEHLAQQIIQVSGRAGRAQKPGLVLIQTLFPDHPLLNKLTEHAYSEIAHDILEQRAEAHWPPFSYLALLRVEAKDVREPMQFLEHIKSSLEHSLKNNDSVSLLGPASAPMAKRAGFYRAQLLFQSSSRPALHQVLYEMQQVISQMKRKHRVRWSLDVDPVELY